MESPALLSIDTNRLAVAIPIKYLTEVRILLESTWHPNCRHFKVSEAQKLTGKLVRLAEGANWVFHLLFNGIIARIPRHRYLDTNRSLLYLMQGPCTAYVICHEASGKASA